VSVYRCQIRGGQTGTLIKNVEPYAKFTDDFNYYLVNQSKLYNSKDELIYDIRTMGWNFEYDLYDKDLSSYISPNNKFIVLNVYNDKKLLVADFTNGRIINAISYKIAPGSVSISYDDNYIVTSSNESSIKYITYIILPKNLIKLYFGKVIQTGNVL